MSFVDTILDRAVEAAHAGALQDAWVWDVYRSARFVKSVRVLTFKDVNVEELPRSEELALPKDVDLGN